MIVAQLAKIDTTMTPELRLFDVPNDDRQVEIRRVARLLDSWLMAQESPAPDPEAVHKVECKLHASIKNSSLFGSVLSFAGLNLWVDERTPEGVVEIQESINL